MLFKEIQSYTHSVMRDQSFWRSNEQQCDYGGLVTKSCLTLVTPWTVAHQAPLSMEFSGQKYWSCCFLLQGIFQIQGLNLGFLHHRQILY